MTNENKLIASLNKLLEIKNRIKDLIYRKFGIISNNLTQYPQIITENIENSKNAQLILGSYKNYNYDDIPIEVFSQYYTLGPYIEYYCKKLDIKNNKATQQNYIFKANQIELELYQSYIPSHFLEVSKAHFTNNNWYNITSVKIKNAIELKHYAFSGQIGIAHVELPDNIKKINSTSFRSCELVSVKYKGITYKDQDSLYQSLIDNEVSVEKESLPWATKIKYTTSDNNNIPIDIYDDMFGIYSEFTNNEGILYLQQGINILMDGTYILPFSESKVNYVELPESITTLGPNSFTECTELVSIDVSGINTFMSNCFYGCSKLKHITFSNKELESDVMYIQTDAFSCTGFESFTFPKRVTSITGCLKQCPNLKEVILQENVTHLSFQIVYKSINMDHFTIKSEQIGMLSTTSFIIDRINRNPIYVPHIYVPLNCVYKYKTYVNSTAINIEPQYRPIKVNSLQIDDILFEFYYGESTYHIKVPVKVNATCEDMFTNKILEDFNFTFDEDQPMDFEDWDEQDETYSKAFEFTFGDKTCTYNINCVLKKYIELASSLTKESINIPGYKIFSFKTWNQFGSIMVYHMPNISFKALYVNSYNNRYALFTEVNNLTVPKYTLNNHPTSDKTNISEYTAINYTTNNLGTSDIYFKITQDVSSNGSVGILYIAIPDDIQIRYLGFFE